MDIVNLYLAQHLTLPSAVAQVAFMTLAQEPSRLESMREELLEKTGRRWALSPSLVSLEEVHVMVDLLRVTTSDAPQELVRDLLAYLAKNIPTGQSMKNTVAENIIRVLLKAGFFGT